MQWPQKLSKRMTTEWEREQYTDQCPSRPEHVIEEKIEHGDKAILLRPRRRSGRKAA
jgi:hypothetical protein